MGSSLYHVLCKREKRSKYTPLGFLSNSTGINIYFLIFLLVQNKYQLNTNMITLWSLGQIAIHRYPSLKRHGSVPMLKSVNIIYFRSIPTLQLLSNNLLQFITIMQKYFYLSSTLINKYMGILRASCLQKGNVFLYFLTRKNIL